MSEKRGIVEYFGSDLAGYECGYCKGQKPSGADCSLWGHYLTADNYQNMIDRGWRRSGKYCYKPDLKRSCCPQYTIKCDALKFRLSKSQKKILKCMFRFLAFGEIRKPYTKQSQELDISNKSQSCLKVPSDIKKSSIVSNEVMQCEERVESVISATAEISMSPVKPCEGDVGKSNKAKVLRFERRLQKIIKLRNCSKEEALLEIRQRRDARVLKYKQKSLHERINGILPENAAHKLEIRFVSTMDEEFEDFEISHKLYQRYQMNVHKDALEECSSKQFRRFLIDSPFEAEKIDMTNDENFNMILPTDYGSYHMQYWLDGELIAIGVIDVLTTCLSSVYFFYDPKYEFLSLGTYSALREIDLTQKLNLCCRNISNYYMGYYIHSCVKMCYKGKYRPSYLLCPEALTWNPIERCLPLLDKSKYQRFELDLNKSDEDGANIPDCDILVLYRKSSMRYTLYKQLTGAKDEDEVKQYSKLMGKHCVNRILLYRSHT